MDLDPIAPFTRYSLRKQISAVLRFIPDPHAGTKDLVRVVGSPDADTWTPLCNHAT